MVFCLRPALIKGLLNLDPEQILENILPSKIVALGLLRGTTHIQSLSEMHEARFGKTKDLSARCNQRDPTNSAHAMLAILRQFGDKEALPLGRIVLDDYEEEDDEECCDHAECLVNEL